MHSSNSIRRIASSSRKVPFSRNFRRDLSTFNVKYSPLTKSHSYGASSTPLILDPIGVVLENTTAQHGDRPALVSRHQSIRWK